MVMRFGMESGEFFDAEWPTVLEFLANSGAPRTAACTINI
jgi:hypothetical protein